METKKKVGRPPSDRSTPDMRAYWRRIYYEKKAKLAARKSQSITPQVEDGEN